MYKTRDGVWTKPICARGDRLQMPDLFEQRDRPFRMTPSVLVEGVLKARASCNDTWRLRGRPGGSLCGMAPRKLAGTC